MYFISLSLHIIYYADFFVPSRPKLEIFQTLWERIFSLHLALSLHVILFFEVGLFLAQPIFSSCIYFHIYSMCMCVCVCVCVYNLLDFYILQWIGSTIFLLSKNPNEISQ